MASIGRADNRRPASRWTHGTQSSALLGCANLDRRWYLRLLVAGALALIALKSGTSDSFSAFGEQSLATRRRALRHFAVAFGPTVVGYNAGAQGAAAASPEDAAKAFLRPISIWMVTNADGAPVLEPPVPGQQTSNALQGLLYLKEPDAYASLKRIQERARDGSGSGLEVREFPLSDVYFSLVQGSADVLGGEFRLEPEDGEVTTARKMLGGVPSLGPPGIVPLFVNLGLSVERAVGEEPRVPAFLHEADMRVAAERAGIGGADDEVIVTTLQRVVDDLSTAGKVCAYKIHEFSASLPTPRASRRLISG